MLSSLLIVLVAVVGTLSSNFSPVSDETDVSLLSFSASSFSSVDSVGSCISEEAWSCSSVSAASPISGSDVSWIVTGISRWSSVDMVLSVSSSAGVVAD